MVNHVRLREERERLTLSQGDFGLLAGVTKQSQHMYEAGKRFPDMQYLAAIAAAGVDVLYILTGNRTAHDFSQAEIELIHAYRNASTAGREAVQSVLNATNIAPNAASTRQVFQAPVGQVIENNQGSARSSVVKK